MPQSRARLLLVEDNPVVGTVLAKLLSDDYQVDRVLGLETARAMLAGTPFAVVVADHFLEDGLGVDVLAHAREVQPEAIRLLMSGDELDELEEWMGAGLVAAFLPKPFKLATFLDLVGDLRGAR
jgi:DNA-binding NtrC family response regulator